MCLWICVLVVFARDCVTCCSRTHCTHTHIHTYTYTHTHTHTHTHTLTQRYPAQQVLSGPYLYQRLNEEKIEKVLSYLIPTNMRVHVVSKVNHNRNNNKKKKKKQKKNDTTDNKNNKLNNNNNNENNDNTKRNKINDNNDNINNNNNNNYLIEKWYGVQYKVLPISKEDMKVSQTFIVCACVYVYLQMIIIITIITVL